MVVRLRCYRHATTKHNVDPLHTPPSERDAIIKSAQHEHGSWFSLKLTSTIPTDIRHLSLFVLSSKWRESRNGDNIAIKLWIYFKLAIFAIDVVVGTFAFWLIVIILALSYPRRGLGLSWS